MLEEEDRTISNRVAEAFGKGDLNTLDEHLALGLA